MNCMFCVYWGLFSGEIEDKRWMGSSMLALGYNFCAFQTCHELDIFEGFAVIIVLEGKLSYYVVTMLHVSWG